MTGRLRHWRYTTWHLPDCSLRFPLHGAVTDLYPGLPVCIVIALAAHFIAGMLGGAEILLALLLGMALSPLHQGTLCRPGIAFASRPLLQFGIALLGARITVDQIGGENFPMLVLVLLVVPGTLVTGMALGRLLRLPPQASLLGAVAVAICGASAALAVAAILPRDRLDRRYLLAVIVGVTGLGTVSMILYPMAAALFGLTEMETGIFLGATIHDVAQAAGAGYMVSDSVGDVATLTKLMRVSMLVPVVAVVSVFCRTSGYAVPKMPWFLLAFFLIAMANSLGYVPETVRSGLTSISRECLLIAMAAMGLKTSLPDFLKLGWRPVAQLTGTSLLLTAAVAFAVRISASVG